MCGDWAESVGLRYGSTLVQARGSHGRLYYGGRQVETALHALGQRLTVITRAA